MEDAGRYAQATAIEPMIRRLAIPLVASVSYATFACAFGFANGFLLRYLRGIEATDALLAALSSAFQHEPLEAVVGAILVGVLTFFGAAFERTLTNEARVYGAVAFFQPLLSVQFSAFSFLTNQCVT